MKKVACLNRVTGYGKQQQEDRKVAEKQKSFKKNQHFIKRAIKKIMEPQKHEFNRLRKLEREWLRLQGKEKVYSVDVELDEIMTFYRVGLVNMYSYFSYELLGKKSISMNRLVHSMLHLPALVEETQEMKRVTLKYIEKDPEMMKRLQEAISKINELGLKTLNGKSVEFNVGNIDSQQFSDK